MKSLFLCRDISKRIGKEGEQKVPMTSNRLQYSVKMDRISHLGFIWSYSTSFATRILPIFSTIKRDYKYYMFIDGNDVSCRF